MAQFQDADQGFGDFENNNLSRKLVTVLDPASAASEAYRMLRTNLFYTHIDTPPKVIVLTSAGPREGKSTTCANLAITLAQAGKNTLVVDCDLRRPEIHNIFGIRNTRGLVDLLIERCELQEVWHEPIPRLKAVSSGPLPPNPAELLSSRRLADFLQQVRQQFDYVLVDTPPVTMVSDPAILARQGDGVVLVLDAQNTRKSALRQALRHLEGVGANMLGTVMNNVETSRDRYYGSTYSVKGAR